MLRLPSAAVVRAPPSAQSCGDSYPIDWDSDEDDEPVPNVVVHRVVRRSSTKVLRKRFYLDHETSARFHDVYEVDERPLGQGGFGSVYRAKLKGEGNVFRAVKKIPRRGTETVVSAKREAAILKRLDHPYVCRLLETFEGDKFMYIVMELAEGQELFDYIHERVRYDDHLDEVAGAEIMRCVFDALSYCHSQGVLHRDLKPENIMVRSSQRPSNNSSLYNEASSTTASSTSSTFHPMKIPVEDPGVEVKLIDFGLATITKPKRSGSGSTPTKSLVGTYAYMAPEVRWEKEHSSKSDVWAAGMVLHAVLLGGLPDEEVRVGEVEVDFTDEAYDHISESSKLLLQGLLKVDPSLRLTSGEAALRCGSIASTPVTPTTTVRDARNTMTSLVSFHRSNMLRKAVLTAMAMQMAGQKMDDLKKQFLAADGNGDGKLSRQELADAISAGSDGYACDVFEWVGSVFDSVDTDGSDSIEYTEWVAAALKEGALRCEEAIVAAFRIFDSDGSGKISQAEFARCLKDGPDELSNIYKQVDSNGDGEIDLDEFRSIILGSDLNLGDRVEPPVAPPPRLMDRESTASRNSLFHFPSPSKSLTRVTSFMMSWVSRKISDVQPLLGDVSQK